MGHVMGDIPIKLQRSSTATKDEDNDKVLTQCLEQLYDDGKRKNEVPLFYGGDAEAMIRTVREFDEVADDLEFTEAHEKFTNFRKCLRDVACDDWDIAKVGQAITIAGFKATMYVWKLMILPEDIYEAQKNYIETVKKLYMMTMASYLPEFPRPMASTALLETDLKNIIFCGVPNAWQENFVHANMRISSITLVQMTNYLASEQVIADTQRDKNPKGRGSSGRNSHNGRDYNPGRGRGYQGRSYQGRGCSSSNKRSSSWMPSNNSRNEAKNDPCRYHGNAQHTWLKSYGNPDGPNYWPGFTPRPHGRTGHGRRGGFRGGLGNGGDWNDAYQNNAATNASSNNNEPSAASTVTNHTNTSGWGAGNQSAKNAAADNHWIDSVGAPE
eukprot:scaffold156847_cov66-Attheya_sp.AAC.1